MDKLWAPWREKYITSLGEKKSGCVFCRIYKEDDDVTNYVFLRSKHAYAVLNIYPYSNGHVLIVPNRHVNDLSKLKRDERDDVMDMLELSKSLLDGVLKPHGFNIGLNLGRAAGAGIPNHIHFHIVPRWKGDVNFMPMVGHTKVISQSLQTVHKLLADAHKKRH
jgi:ATP adenylyltransferase